MEDLISIGTIGLIKAVTTFDYTKGTRLGTYAARCIDNELLMMLRAKKKMNREVSLYEPMGTDKEGNEINLLDIMEGPNEYHSIFSAFFHIQTLPLIFLMLFFLCGTHNFWISPKPRQGDRAHYCSEAI